MGGFGENFKIQSVKWFTELFKKLHWLDCQILIKKKRVKGISCTVLCCAAFLTLCDPMDCSLPGSSLHQDPSGKNTRAGFQGLPT